MGSRVGYEYRYNFSAMDEDEINPLYKLYLVDGRNAVFFEIRTNFILKGRPEECVGDAIMDSETYDARVYSQGDELKDERYLDFMAGYRLKEYWMTEDEINLFVKEAVAFAKHIAANPRHASLNLIPVVVDIEVCTVQQQGESFGDCMDRAIRARDLVPLYLWPQSVAVERKPISVLLMCFLKKLRRIRLEDTDEGLALMQVCTICSRNTNIGAQISFLPCHHSFHSHCIVRWLEDQNLCPSCDSPAYDPCIVDAPPFKLPRS